MRPHYKRRIGRTNPTRGPDGKFGSGFNRELGAKIIAGVRDGLFDTQNGLRNNVHHDTIQSWVSRGMADDADPELAEFAEEYIKASIEVERSHVGHILESPDWRARAWWLERRHPRRWRESRDGTEPRDSLKLPTSNDARGPATSAMLANPSPELIEAFRRNGFDLVRRQDLPALDCAEGEEETCEEEQTGEAGQEDQQGNEDAEDDPQG